MKEGSPISHPENISTQRRISAVAETFISNRSAQIDSALATIGALSPLLWNPESQNDQTIPNLLIGGFLGVTALLSRTAVNQHRDDQRREQAALGDWGSYHTSDPRTVVGYTRDAWKSGQPQQHTHGEGRVDGSDKMRYSFRK